MVVGYLCELLLSQEWGKGCEPGEKFICGRHPLVKQNMHQKILLKQKVLTQSQKSPSGQIQESLCLFKLAG